LFSEELVPNKMTDINLSEVSLVDYPAHLISGFAVIKSANPNNDEALKSAFRKETMSDKDIAEVLKGMSAEDVLKALTPEQLASVEKAVGKAPAPKKVITEGEDTTDSGNGKGSEPVGQVGDKADVTPADAEDASDHGADDATEGLNGEKKKVGKSDEDLMKSVSPEVRAMIEKSNIALAAATAQVAKANQDAEIAKAAALDSEAVSFSKSAYSNLGFDHSVVAPALRKFALSSPVAAESITTLLKAVNEQTSGVFKELGTSAVPSSGMTPADRITALAKAKTSESVSFAKAYESVVNDPANAELVTAHFNSKE
jgi:hypothetical protein